MNHPPPAPPQATPSGAPPPIRRLIASPVLIAFWAALLFLPFKGVTPAVIAFVSILAGLLLISLGRRFGFGDFTKRALPVSVMSSLRSVTSQWFFFPLLLISLLGLPLGLNDYYLDVLIMAGIYALLALGLNVVVGFAGLLNLGFAAFYAIGAYTYALLNTQAGLGFWACLPISALFASLAGLLLAIPALRLRGDYLAIVTLGFGEITRLVLNNWDSLTNGPNGITGIAPPSLPGFSLGALNRYYYLVFVLLLLSTIIVRRVKYSRIGRAWIAIRENEIAASSMGINTTKYKLYAFVFGSFWAGIAGILFAAKMRFVSPESFTFMESVLIISMVILGGLGSVYGAVLGAFILVILPEMLREVQLYRMLILGIGLVLLMVFKPQGLLGGPRDVRVRS